MNEKTISQKKLGEWIGVSGSMVGYWFTGKKRLSIDSAQRLEYLVGIPWTQLLAYRPEELETVIRDGYDQAHGEEEAV